MTTWLASNDIIRLAKRKNESKKEEKKKKIKRNDDDEGRMQTSTWSAWRGKKGGEIGGRKGWEKCYLEDNE